MDGAEWLRTQLTSFGCASCGRGYRSPDIRVVAERDELFFVELGCAGCGASADAIVTIQIEDSSVQADLGELGTISGRAHVGSVEPRVEPVRADDVLSMHEFLERFDGDFASLFERSARGDRDQAVGAE